MPLSNDLFSKSGIDAVLVENADEMHKNDRILCETIHDPALYICVIDLQYYIETFRGSVPYESANHLLRKECGTAV